MQAGFAKTRRLLLPGVIVALFWSPTASAEETTPVRPFLLEVRSGFNTSTDMLGLAASVHPVKYLGAGVGIGVAPAGTPQFAALAKVRPVSGVVRSRRHSLLVEVAYSHGEYRPLFPTAPCDVSEGPCPRFQVSVSAAWLHTDVAWETESSSEFSLRLGAGVAALLNPASLYCDSERCSALRLPLASVTLGVGYAF